MVCWIHYFWAMVRQKIMVEGGGGVELLLVVAGKQKDRGGSKTRYKPPQHIPQ
jgi:hypothetical protein